MTDLDKEILSFIKRYSLAIPSESAFDALALRIFRHQFEHNSHYRKFCLLENKTPASVATWKEIPAIPTMGFKELVLATFPIKKAIKVFRTSGTTQGALRRGASAIKAPADTSLRGVHFFDTLKLYETSIVPAFRRYLLADDAKLSYHFLIAPPFEAKDSSLSYMMGVVSREFARGQGKFYHRKGKLLLKELAKDLRRACDKAVILLATAFSLKAFIDYLASEKLRLHLAPGSRIMETGGFKGQSRSVSKTTLYASCGKYLGVPASHCVSEYGMTELSSQSYDTTLRDHVMGVRKKPFKKNPAWMRTLVIDPRSNRETKPGRKGLLRHFDLANRGSVMALQTEDLGYAVKDGFELIGRAGQADLRGCSLSYEEFLKN